MQNVLLSRLVVRNPIENKLQYYPTFCTAAASTGPLKRYEAQIPMSS